MTTTARYGVATRSTPVRTPDVRRLSNAWDVRAESLTIEDITLENGAHRDATTVHFRLEGTIAPTRDNLVLVIHALTGTSHATDWWSNVINVGGAIDPTRHAVLCATLVDGADETVDERVGETVDHDATDIAASSPFSIRDHATVLARLLDALDVKIPLLVCGGSLGGMVALEFAASFPDRVRAAVVLAAPATQTAQGIAWNAIMQRAIAIGGPRDGLALARMVGMLSYRTPHGLERRFGRTRHADGAFRVHEWLTAHGERLVNRFSAGRYRKLVCAMDTHDVGRGRGGVANALSAVGHRLTGVGIPGDLLFPAEVVQQWTRESGATYHELTSEHGHDAFLIEGEQVGRILRAAIAPTTPSPTAPPAVRRRSTSTRPRRLALAGCGHVGGALLDLLSDHNTAAPLPLSVERILVRDGVRVRPPIERGIHHGSVSIAPCTTDPTQLLGDDIDVLVEAIGGITTARTLVETALHRGIRVVTANKALLAAYGPELQQLARSNGTRIDFEGAVGGAIPVIRCLRTGAAGVGVTRIDAILNGTSNFVLGRAGQIREVADAISDAQRLGFAEADPSRDLSGADAEDKLRVLAWLAFGVHPTALQVVRQGIDADVWARAARAAADGDVLKLIATCEHESGSFIGQIRPMRFSKDSPWASVHEADNRVVITSASAGALVLQGPGAGGRATAGALLSDLLAPPHVTDDEPRAAGPRTGSG